MFPLSLGPTLQPILQDQRGPVVPFWGSDYRITLPHTQTHTEEVNLSSKSMFLSIGHCRNQDRTLDLACQIESQPHVRGFLSKTSRQAVPLSRRIPLQQFFSSPGPPIPNGRPFPPADGSHPSSQKCPEKTKGKEPGVQMVRQAPLHHPSKSVACNETKTIPLCLLTDRHRAAGDGVCVWRGRTHRSVEGARQH